MIWGDYIKHFLRYWFPPLAWCAVIFIQSAFATLDAVPHWPYIDKVLHAGGYALLGGLFYRALNSLSGLKGRRVRIIILATIMTTLYGLSDEWHQSFVAERSSEFSDLLADFIGGALGAYFYGNLSPATTTSKK